MNIGCHNCSHVDRRAHRCGIHDANLPVISSRVLCADWTNEVHTAGDFCSLKPGLLYYLYSTKEPQVLRRLDELQQIIFELYIKHHEELGWCFYVFLSAAHLPEPGNSIQVEIDGADHEFHVVTKDVRRKNGKVVAERLVHSKEEPDRLLDWLQRWFRFEPGEERISVLMEKLSKERCRLLSTVPQLENSRKNQNPGTDPESTAKQD